ncbi:hypothetical protein B0T16DRAFT_210338 [Cercophora newfieldiana]|uniref:NACHT domain-containing protein n=1 Tax=Cercophora newfieldiana TaxID=92897 RepID=A0AA39XVS8_9PEZI|nr:hypothetical protein B0T16DRAFT_210338 [Cercophora newfieldiana]
MAEALVFVGLAGNILQFIEQGYHLIKFCSKTYHSSEGAASISKQFQLLTEDVEAAKNEVERRKRSGTLSASEDELVISKYAAECEKVAAELNSILAKFAIPDGKTPGLFRAFGLSVYAVKYRSKLEQLEAKLADLQSRLQARLARLFSEQSHSATMSVLSTLASAVQQGHQRTAAGVESSRHDVLDALQKSRQDILDALQRSDPTPSELVRLLTSLQSQQRKLHEARIINSLLFPEIKQRRAEIDKACEMSLSWLLDPQKVNLLDWLRHENGIYWITGLAGSGKSTIMKYLLSSPAVGGALSEWAGQSRLVTPSFFFWIGGTPMQKSILGLLQTLLYEMVQADPALVAAICSVQRNPEEPWTVDELFEVFLNVPSASSEGTKFCCFIDGLDEYDGEEKTVIETMQRLSALPGFKICVASRPWNAFKRAYGKNPWSFAVEDFIKDDIAAYVRVELATHSPVTESVMNDKRFTALQDEVVARAQGVWLWVYLVVRDMQKDLDSSETMDHVWGRLEQFPRSLEEYFDRVLKKIDPIDLLETARILLLLLEPSAFDRVPLVTPIFIEAERQDAEYAIHTDRPKAVEMFSVAYDDRDKVRRDERLARIRLNERCRDLVVAQPRDDSIEGSPDGLGWGHIQLLHRTVADYLNDKHLPTLKQAAGPSFSVFDCSINMMVAAAKAYPRLCFYWEDYLDCGNGHERYPIQQPFHSFVKAAQTRELADTPISGTILEEFLYTLLAASGGSDQLQEALELPPTVSQYAELGFGSGYKTIDAETMMMVFAISNSLTSYIRSSWRLDFFDRIAEAGYDPLTLAEKSASEAGKAATVILLTELRASQTLSDLALPVD